jgi:transcription elongation factor GreA
MTNEALDRTQATLSEALNDYLETLKPDQRHAQETFVRRYVEHAGERMPVAMLSGSRVESYVESQIKPSDPNAPDRVSALKLWFQFLRKRNYTATNYGIHVRVRRSGGRAAGSNAVRVEQSPLEMTAEGIETLRSELAVLTAETPDLIQAIAHAREDKDFRENAPLEAAREALAFNEQRRKRLENSLKRAVVVERQSHDRSALGSTVTVTRLDTGRQSIYKLVGAREANAGDQRISVESPVGRELLGRRPGDEVRVAAPSGLIQFRIEEVTHE